MDIPSVEFLVESGFQEVEYPDGIFWMKWGSSVLIYQYDPIGGSITEDEGGWIEELTCPELIAKLTQHNAANIQ